MMTRLHIWWMCLAEEKVAFYFINTPVQLLILFIPIFIIDEYADGWWRANPELFDSMAYPFLFGWLALFFIARWLISTIIVEYYSDIEVDFSE